MGVDSRVDYICSAWVLLLRCFTETHFTIGIRFVLSSGVKSTSAAGSKHTWQNQCCFSLPTLPQGRVFTRQRTQYNTYLFFSSSGPQQRHCSVTLTGMIMAPLGKGRGYWGHKDIRTVHYKMLHWHIGMSVSGHSKGLMSLSLRVAVDDLWGYILSSTFLHIFFFVMIASSARYW